MATVSANAKRPSPQPVSIDSACEQLRALNPKAESYALEFVETSLTAAHRLGASDVHLQPTADGLQIAARIDGVLQPWGVFARGETSDIVTRLKVLADLLTYRTDVPQEGRVRNSPLASEIRLTCFPTLYGEKAVVRFFAAESQFHYLDDLGLPHDTVERIGRLLQQTSGAVLITGPAGSGKTTTAYACLREIVRASAAGRSVATLEDPIEMAITGVAQSQVNPAAGFDLAAGLRSLLRQDPEVILVGEMRDPVTAGVALQAALTGQLVLTTFHAGSAAGAISRLLDMGLEPYMLRSGIHAVLCQRLVRRLCDCAESSDAPDAKLGLGVSSAKVARSCELCHGTGYRGRMLLAEMLACDSKDIARGILSRWDADRLEQAAVAGGMRSRWAAAAEAVESGRTSAAEIRRVLGFSDAISSRDG